jgi:hypothetical protein
MSAALLVVFPAFARAQDPTPDSFRELETKYIFGFTFGSDIGPEGERELELTTNVNFQKRTGSYVALKQEAELEYNPTDSLQIELGAAGIYHAISSVEGFDDFHGANFAGLSSTFRYLLIARGPGSPIGLQIAVEPEWSRVDNAGKLVTTFEAETRIIADTELVPDRLFAAFNLIYTPEIEREFGSPDWQRASTLGVLGALTYRIMPKVTLGAELEYYRVFEGLGLFWPEMRSMWVRRSTCRSQTNSSCRLPSPPRSPATPPATRTTSISPISRGIKPYCGPCSNSDVQT